MQVMALYKHRSRAPSAYKRGGPAGFSILELVVVMTLLSIITAAIVPVYVNSMAAVKLRSAQNNFVATLAHVQQAAVMEGREFRVYIDDDEMCYWVSAYLGEEDDDKIFEDIQADYGQFKYLPEGLEFDRVKARKDRENNAKFIGCYPNGACDQVEIVLRDTRRRGASYEVRTLGLLGKIEVEE